MPLATPSAHEACPAPVIGISPMRKAADRPRTGVRVNSSNAASLRDEDIRHAVVVAARPLEALDVPAVGEHDLVPGDHRHQQRGDPVVADHQLTSIGGHEAGGHVLGVSGARPEVPGPGDPVAAVDGLAEAVREELAARP